MSFNDFMEDDDVWSFDVNAITAIVEFLKTCNKQLLAEEPFQSIMALFQEWMQLTTVIIEKSKTL